MKAVIATLMLLATLACNRQPSMWDEWFVMDLVSTPRKCRSTVRPSGINAGPGRLLQLSPYCRIVDMETNILTIDCTHEPKIQGVIRFATSMRACEKMLSTLETI